MLSKYTKQMVLCYDGDQAGQNAAKRAISILEPTGMSVRVLRMQGAKDPDEFLKKYGADRFRQLLGQSENQAAYQLETIRRKHDLSTDEGKVDFLKEAATFISTMSSAVEREVYTGRAAELAGVKPDALKNEVDRARRNAYRAQKKKEEKKLLRPADTVQPADRSMRYEDVKSARAEEGVISQLFLEPALLEKTSVLSSNDFSAPVFAKTYSWMQRRYSQDLPINITSMSGEFTPEEIAHITNVVQNRESVVNEQALGDYIARIREQAAKRNDKDLAAAMERYRDKKGYGG